MLQSTPSPSPEWRRVRAKTKSWVIWATVLAGQVILWSLWRAGYGFTGLASMMVNALLLESYQSHRIAGTDRGIELRTIWWREIVGWGELSSLETRPGYWRKDILLTQRHDPPWQIVVTTANRKLVVSTRKSVAEAMRADFERMRASKSGTDAIAS